ncbi:MAG: KpsF/GutQ family sugar-phosphate isomerase [Saprospiraceae bacterium]|nr:KpsF/GutQ family sugar-phosphate isomerase [Saprospiraceae bacterium]
MRSKNLIQETARNTIEIEKQALGMLLDSINGQFIAAVEAIFQSKGRLVLTGIGKSAIVAQKITATLNSTGSPAIFMHAADAIHGDLGMIQANDMVLCISKSGETSEIKVLVPLVKHLGNSLIGMVGRADCFLGQQANYTLLTPIIQEADPNNLAPTASTTAQMALGDAIATSLLALRGFSPTDFAQFHPGGILGKQMYLRVADVYTQNEKPQVAPDATIRQTILEMTSKRLGCTVVSLGGKIQGIITDGDLRRMLEREKDTAHLCARDIMTVQPRTIAPEALAIKALELMREKSITQLAVASEDNYLGIIHLHDLIREGLV